MQVIRTNHLHYEKEIWKEDFRKQQETGGQKSIVTIGDRAECPQCSKMGHIVWVSQDGKTAGIQCPASHSLTNYPPRFAPKFGKTEQPRAKTNRNVVFLMEIK